MTKHFPLRKWAYFVVAGKLTIGWLARAPGKRSRLSSIQGGKPVGKVYSLQNATQQTGQYLSRNRNNKKIAARSANNPWQFW
jgi:hypothetical protein